MVPSVSLLQVTRVVVDERAAPWGKALADIDGDGVLEVIVGGGGLGGHVYWYQYPAWARFQIGTTGGGDDLQVGDLDGDGAVDVVVNGGEIIWYENPRGKGGDPRAPWVRHVIDPSTGSHDLVLGDVDGDGRLDAVIRTTLGPTILYLQRGADSWIKVPFATAPDGQGLALADLNRDGRVDIVGNGYWLEQPSDPVQGTWVRHAIGPWGPGASVAVADINGDGRPDVVIAASESGVGELAWFEAPPDPIGGMWSRHDVDTVNDVHRFHVLDANGDGQADIVFAEMHQSGRGFRRVGIYFNAGRGASWTLQVLDHGGSHNIAVGNIEGQGGIGILGANWSPDAPDGGAVTLWRLGPRRSASTGWTYIAVDKQKTDAAFGLAFSDLDGDGRLDIVSGRYWYRNPGGDLTGTWQRHEIHRTSDAMLALDVDGDGRPDVIAQGPAGDGSAVFWHKPLDAAATRWSTVAVGKVPGVSRDLPGQGYVVARLEPGPRPQIVLAGDFGLYYFRIPDQPAAGGWPRVQIAGDATQEGIDAGDIDGDGRVDVAGSAHLDPRAPGREVVWWRNPGIGAGSWTRHAVGTTAVEIDRLRLPDINGDGRLDIVVTDTEYRRGFGNLYWFEHLRGGRWLRHLIAGNLGALHSLDMGDLNGDGQVDLVVGEHRGHGLRIIIWENVGRGATWRARVIDAGKESHLGTRLADLRGHGPLDIVSIAFDTSQFVHLWRYDGMKPAKPAGSQGH